MKRLTTTFVLIFTVLFSSLFATNTKLNKEDPRYAQYENNLITGLKSDNEGLRFSSAYLLGEIKSELAVDLLTRMLRSHENENFRIMAALSLSKIGTDQALYMVKRVGKFTDHTKLATFCDKFYKARTYSLPADDKVLVSSLFE